MSCDGRDRKYKTSTEVLQENNLLKSFNKKIITVQSEQIQIVTDTILSNGFQVKINYKSVVDNPIIKRIKSLKDSITELYYKNFEAEILVLKNGILINEGVIMKSLFKEFGNTSFWKNSTMQFVWIDHENLTDNHIFLKTSFNLVNTDIYKDFIIKIDNDGNIQIKETTLSKTII
ncbi:MAG: hypothetical protein ACO3VF_03465 [Tamlana sp.]